MIFTNFNLTSWAIKGVAVVAVAGALAYGVHAYNNSLRAQGAAKVQALWDIDKAAQQAAATESLRRNEIKANNTKDKYDKDLQNHSAAANGLDVVFERLRNTENPSNCSPTTTDTAGALSTPAPRFEW